MLGDGSDIGPVEALVAQMSVSSVALAWPLAALIGTMEGVALTPLIGLVWVGFRARARSSEQSEQVEMDHDPEQVHAEMTGGDA